MANPSELQWETVRPGLPAGHECRPDKLRQAVCAAEKLYGLLSAATAAGEPVLLLVNDPHRSTRTAAALSALAELAARLPESLRFRALIAAGTHRFGVEERRRFEQITFAQCGLKIAAIAWHDAADQESLARLGPVHINRRLAESRFIVPIGSVEPHYFAGLTGAHKTVTIGCLSRADIERNHAGALEPAADILRLRGNPVYDDIIEVARALTATGKTICAINQVVHGDDVVAAAVGDLLDTLDRLLPTVRQVYLRHVPHPTDLLRLRVPPPLGRNLYQADKALKNNHRAVRDGGAILLEADCPERIGPDAFLSLLRRAPDYATARRIVADQGYHLGDHKALKLRQLTDPTQRGVHVALVTRHVSAADARTAGIKVFPAVAPALRWLGDVIQPPPQHGLIIENAGNVTVTTGT